MSLVQYYLYNVHLVHDNQSRRSSLYPVNRKTNLVYSIRHQGNDVIYRKCETIFQATSHTQAVLSVGMQFVASFTETLEASLFVNTGVLTTAILFQTFVFIQQTMSGCKYVVHQSLVHMSVHCIQPIWRNRNWILNLFPLFSIANGVEQDICTVM